MGGACSTDCCIHTYDCCIMREDELHCKENMGTNIMDLPRTIEKTKSRT